eukprot:TRINITY_DN30887_c0_g1_i1.p1 TRINITY_DN30887_c0_g1~~TRINITY_DN30887_c0_g1_i1.p1  ORF type:complete len:895 (+),score=57.98 TRINITY_DN30887_c0_g1_i1:36-2720(+)
MKRREPTSFLHVRLIMLKCFTYAMMLRETVAVTNGGLLTTIHLSAAPDEMRVDFDHWPCLQFVASDDGNDTQTRVAFLQCSVFADEVRWLIPDAAGPIRLASTQNKCLDAGEGAAAAREQAPLENRTVVLKPCDGSPQQHFILDHPAKRRTVIRVGSGDTYGLETYGTSLIVNRLVASGTPLPHVTLMPRQATKYRYFPAEVWYHVAEIAYVLSCLLLCGYAFLIVKQAYGCDIGAIVNLIGTPLDTYREACMRIRNSSSCEIRAEYRLGRAKTITRCLSYTTMLWMTFHVVNTPHIPWRDSRAFGANLDAIRECIYESEALPVMFLAIICFVAQLRPFRSAEELDGLTVALAVMWALKYYLLSQSSENVLLECYLFQEAWMIMARIFLNVAIGRSEIVIPCNIIVTAADVYCLQHSTKLKPDDDISTTYLVKQLFACIIACGIQVWFEDADRRSERLVCDVHHARLKQQFTSRMLESMCDEVVFLDQDFNITKPAPKLTSMLRLKSGSDGAQNFMSLVRIEDRRWLVKRLRSLKLTSTDEHAVIVQFSLIDSQQQPRRVQALVCRFPIADEVDGFFALCITEVQEFGRSTVGESERACVESEKGGHLHTILGRHEDESDPSCRESLSQATYEVMVCPYSARILRVCEDFIRFMGEDVAGKILSTLFPSSETLLEWILNRMESIGRDSTEPVCRDGLILVRGDAQYDAALEIHDIVNDGWHAGERCKIVLRISPRRLAHTHHATLPIPMSDVPSERLPNESLVHPSDFQAPLQLFDNDRVTAVLQITSCAKDLVQATNFARDLGMLYYSPFLQNRSGQWMDWFQGVLLDRSLQLPHCSSHGRHEIEVKLANNFQYVLTTRMIVSDDEMFAPHTDVLANADDAARRTSASRIHSL